MTSVRSHPRTRSATTRRRDTGAFVLLRITFAHGDQENVMQTLAQAVYFDSEFGAERDLPHAGSALENPYVFDDVAREIKTMAQRGLIEILDEQVVSNGGEPLSVELRFKRIR